MPFHKLATDGPITLTVNSAILKQGPNPKFPPQLLLSGDTGGEYPTTVPLSALGALKQFKNAGAGPGKADGLALDTEMPEFYGTWYLEMVALDDGSKVTRVKRVADADWERLRDDESRPSALDDEDDSLPFDEPRAAPKPTARVVTGQKVLQPRLAPQAQVPAAKPPLQNTVSTQPLKVDYAAQSQALYDRHLVFALKAAEVIAQAGYGVDVNAIVATLMIDTQKRGG